MLKKLSINGVQTIFSAHKFKWVSNYGTFASKASETPNSRVDYLVNSLGFSKEEAIITSSKVSTPFKSTENPNSVIDFFKVSGFSQSQIKHLVSREPRILSSKVDKTLKPKIQALLDLGFSKSDLAHVISLCPEICRRSLNPDVVSLLKSYGLSDDQIKLFALRKPAFFTSVTKWLKAVLIRVENLGIPRGSGMFFHGICALCSISEVSLDARKRIYKSYGFTDEDVLTLARNNPYALKVSEPKLRNCLHFFMKEAGYLPFEIAFRPIVLNLSLEKRVIPRYRVWEGLKERAIQKVTKKKIKNINASFFTNLRISEPQFFEKYVQPFKDECPDLYSDYVKVARPSLF